MYIDVFVYIRLSQETNAKGWIYSVKGWGKVNDWQLHYYKLPQLIQSSFHMHKLVIFTFSAFGNTKNHRGEESISCPMSSKQTELCWTNMTSTQTWWGRPRAICSFLPPKASTEETELTSNCISFFCIHQLKKHGAGGEIFPLENLWWAYKAAESFVQQLLFIQWLC